MAAAACCARAVRESVLPGFISKPEAVARGRARRALTTCGGLRSGLRALSHVDQLRSTRGERRKSFLEGFL